MDLQNLPEETQKLIGQAIQGYFRNQQQSRADRQKLLNRFVLKHQILFTGSSLMEHFPIEEFRLAQGIEPVIYNRAIGGFTTDDFLANIDSMLLEPQPSKVFINIGTNDISTRIAPDGDWLSHLVTNYEKILARLKKELPECRVYLMAYYPSNMEVIRSTIQGAEAFGLRTLDNIRLANEAVKKLADSFGYFYIDVNDGLADENGNLKKELTTDGVHMYPEAYMQILCNMKPYLQ